MKILPEKEEIRSEKVTFHAEKELKNLINYPESHKFHQFLPKNPPIRKNFSINLKKISIKGGKKILPARIK